MRRVPRQDLAPVAQVAFNVSLVPATAYTRLDEDSLAGSFPDVMCCRPPRLHMFHEDAEGALDGGLHAHGLTYDGFFHFACHVSLPMVVFPLLLERRSMPWSTSGRSGRGAVPRLRDLTGRGGGFRTS